jgi:hypothetical protein
MRSVSWFLRVRSTPQSEPCSTSSITSAARGLEEGAKQHADVRVVQEAHDLDLRLEFAHHVCRQVLSDQHLDRHLAVLPHGLEHLAGRAFSDHAHETFVRQVDVLVRLEELLLAARAVSPGGGRDRAMYPQI